jgi:formylglycine-generating enzyme required for sulfatase activity
MSRIVLWLLLSLLILVLPVAEAKSLHPPQPSQAVQPVQPAFSAPDASAVQRQGRRVALVVGNGAYKDGPLKNPVNDARDMANALRVLGFEVILLENAGLAQMEQAVDQFWEGLKKGGTGLFFFAGHGMQVKGVNYLVPVDARLVAEQDVKVRCLDVNLVLGRMENAGNPLNIILLDACRNNPFARSWRNSGQGLAKMDAPAGTLVAYATAPDSVAADGEGRNGLYTSHLLRHLSTPGLKVEDVLKQVRVGVMNDTGRRQIPWESSSLTGDFYFAGGAAQGAVPAQQLALGPVPKETPAAPAAAPKAGDSWTDPVTGMEFKWVPGGDFEMGPGPWAGSVGFLGSNSGTGELPVHTVHVDGFWVGTCEVTQGQWEKVMGDNPASFQLGDNYPVEMVTWQEAKKFVSRLNAKSSVKFRLPREAEWEYAARSGGKPEKFAGGGDADLNRLAWHGGNSGGTTHEVGTKAPNGLGLFDMTGNVAEWVEDAWDFNGYSKHTRSNPLIAVDSGLGRVVRGGAWDSSSDRCRNAGRSSVSLKGPMIGLRLVRVP